MAFEVTVLPLPDSPTIQTVSPGFICNVTSLIAVNGSLLLVKSTFKSFISSNFSILLTPYLTLFAFGSKVSRSLSPIMLMERTKRVMARPGKDDIHHATDKYPLPCDSSAPQSGISLMVPRPKKLNPDPIKMDVPRPIVPITNKGDQEFGRICQKNIFQLDVPIERDASTNFLFLILII